MKEEVSGLARLPGVADLLKRKKGMHDLVPGCRYNAESQELLCKPQLLLGDDTLVSKRDIVFQLDAAGKLVIKDDGEASQKLLDATIDHVETRMLRGGR